MKTLVRKAKAPEQPTMSTPEVEPSAEDLARASHRDDEQVSRAARPRREAKQTSYLPDAHRKLPQSLDAEKGVLCSCMLSPALIEPTFNLLTTSAFYDHRTRMIAEVMVELDENREFQGLASTGFVDPTLFHKIQQTLLNRNRLDAAGGAPFLVDVSIALPTATSADYYIEIVRDKFTRRQIVDKMAGFSERARDEQSDVALIFEECERELKALGNIQRFGGLPPMRDISQMTGANRPAPPQELVKGLLHRGSKAIIGGTSKGRKTFSLLDMAISVATGTPWWGFDCQQGKVCYINFEIQESFFVKRYEDICRKKEVMPKAGTFMQWTLRGMVEGIEKMSDQIIKALLDYDFALIVIDPIYKALGDRDENKAGDVASLCNELERIAVKTGAAIAFGAHYSKGNQAAKEAIDRIGGSGVFARDPDTILTMTPHTEEECYTVEATLRNFPPTKPFVVEWDWPTFERNDGLDPEELKKPKKEVRARSESDGKFKEQYSVDDIIDVLKKTTNGRRAGELQLLCHKEIGIERRHFYNLWKKVKLSPSVYEKDWFWFHISSAQS